MLYWQIIFSHFVKKVKKSKSKIDDALTSKSINKAILLGNTTETLQTEAEKQEVKREHVGSKHS